MIVYDIEVLTSHIVCIEDADLSENTLQLIAKFLQNRKSATQTGNTKTLKIKVVLLETCCFSGTAQLVGLCRNFSSFARVRG